jgi:putative transposase
MCVPWPICMVRRQLDDRQWAKVSAFLESERGPGRPAKDDRNFIEAVLWWRRTGVPWRDLPDEFGPWQTVFNRFDRWSKQGRWHRLLAAMRTDVDDEWHSIDATNNRAHQHAAGGKGGRRAMPSVGHVVVHPRRCISSSMHSACRSTSK